MRHHGMRQLLSIANSSTVKNATFGGALGIDGLQGRFGAGMGASRAVARTAMMKTRQRAASQARSGRKLYPAAARTALAASPWRRRDSFDPYDARPWRDR